MNFRKFFRENKYRSSIKELGVNITKTIKLYWEIDKISFIVFFTTVVLLGLAPFLISYLFGQIVNKTISYVSGDTSITSGEIIKQFIFVGCLALVDNLLWSLTNLARRISRYNWQSAMTTKVLAKISSLDFIKYEDREFNNFMNKIKDGYAWKPETFANTIPWTLFNLIKMISSIVILVNFAPLILPLIFLSFVPIFLIEISGSKLSYGIWETKGDDKRLFAKTSSYLSDPGFLSEIKIFGIRNYLIDFAKKLFTNFENEQKKIVKKTQINSMLASFFGFGIVIGIEVWMLTKVLAKTGFGIGNFTFYRSTIYNFSGSVRDLTRNFIDLYDNNLFMTDLFKLFEAENTITTKENAIQLSSDKPPTIEFKNVFFKYPNTEKYIYKNFSLKINPGEDIALVGENGAGKTTFVKLLMRFYDVDEGEILVNGIPLKDLDLESWYKNIGVLFQDFNKYSYTVGENVYLGDIAKANDQEQIKLAAINSGADSFVSEYKNNYKQFLNKSFDDGIDPSGGQWQKIALARAFFRNANILILDEPTSAIDAKAEYEIFKKISKVQEQKTTIIISHRFSTVRNANKIYVIDHGEIIESGSHEELMKIKKGKYKNLFELQAEGYK